VGSSGKWGLELAGGEVVEGAEAAAEVAGAQAALAVEPAQKLVGRALCLLRVALRTARNEVAVGIAAQLRARHDVVEAPGAPRNPPQTIKAAAPLAGVDGFLQRTVLEEVRRLEAPLVDDRGGGRKFGHAHARNLLGRPHLHHMTGLAAFDQTQCAVVEKAVQCVARDPDAETGAVGKPADRKTDARLAFQVAMPQQIRVDSTVFLGFMFRSLK
jgi:hypothetical protein